MHERRYTSDFARLRDPQRVALLEVPRVVERSLEGLEGVRSVLDVGTGSGLFAEQFAAKGLSVSGVDANPDMLPVARQYVPGGVFREGEAENLPFPDASFDLVFMGVLLHETDDAAAAVREAHRVSTRRLAILEWRYAEQPFGAPLEHRLKPEMISKLVSQAGFRSFQIVEMQNLTLYLCDH